MAVHRLVGENTPNDRLRSLPSSTSSISAHQLFYGFKKKGNRIDPMDVDGSLNARARFAEEVLSFEEVLKDRVSSTNDRMPSPRPVFFTAEKLLSLAKNCPN